ncbi:hypothetical protein TNCV_2843181 [Trichonephila clavipes]|nr:hypothetical protein TNCV_2843181 [Trichonephila clavipes]
MADIDFIEVGIAVYEPLKTRHVEKIKSKKAQNPHISVLNILNFVNTEKKFSILLVTAVADRLSNDRHCSCRVIGSSPDATKHPPIHIQVMSVDVQIPHDGAVGKYREWGTSSSSLSLELDSKLGDPSSTPLA